MRRVFAAVEEATDPIHVLSRARDVVVAVLLLLIACVRWILAFAQVRTVGRGAAVAAVLWGFCRMLLALVAAWYTVVYTAYPVCGYMHQPALPHDVPHHVPAATWRNSTDLAVGPW